MIRSTREVPIRSHARHPCGGPSRSTKACSRTIGRWSRTSIAAAFARRGQSRRADHADRLRRHRGTIPVQKVLRAVSAWNDGVQETIFRPNHLAPTFSPAQVVKPPRFNAYYDIEDVKPVDGATWKLELAGRIDDKRPWTAQQIYQLPEQEIIIRHVCVEGWDYIGQWSGVEPARFSAARRRRSDGQIRLFHLRRRLYRKHRHGDRRCIRRPFSPPNMPATSSPIRSAIRCGCAPRPSSATRTRNGSRPSKSPTISARRSGASRALTGSPGFKRAADALV